MNTNIALAAAPKDPRDYEWYEFTGKRATFENAHKSYDLTLETGDKFGVRESRGYIYLLDPSAMTIQFKLEPSEFKKLTRRTKGYSGKIGRYKVKPGGAVKDTAIPVPTKGQKVRSVRVVDAPIKRKRTDAELPDPYADDIVLPIAKKRRRYEPAPKFSDDTAVKPAAGKPKQSKVVNTAPKRQPRHVKLDLPARRPPAAIFEAKDNESKALFRHLQALRLELAPSPIANTFTSDARKVFDWLLSVSLLDNPDVQQAFGVKYADQSKWPDVSRLHQFILEAIAKAVKSQGTLKAVNGLKKHQEFLLSKYAPRVAKVSLWNAHVLNTRAEVEDFLIAFGYKLTSNSSAIYAKNIGNNILQIHAEEAVTKNLLGYSATLGGSTPVGKFKVPVAGKVVASYLGTTLTKIENMAVKKADKEA